jgi:hypothetical protein
MNTLVRPQELPDVSAEQRASNEMINLDLLSKPGGEKETLRRAAPSPPCCPTCYEIMSFKSKEKRTLLRGYQLSNYTFECNICGYASARMAQEE